MKAGAEKQREMILYAVLGIAVLGCVFYTYNMLFGGPSTTAPPPAPVIVAGPTVKTTTSGSTKEISTPPGFAVGAAAQKIATTNGKLDPTLHEESMHVTESIVYTGNGRNIFGLGPAPVEVAMVKPVAPPRPIVAQTGPPPPPPGPPPPPPIDLKFFGTATAGNGSRRAFLLHGEDVFLASDGDIVQRRYKVISIASNSIVIEDMPNNNKQTLPLQAN
jgi:hypothetical protein